MLRRKSVSFDRGSRGRSISWMRHVSNEVVCLPGDDSTLRGQRGHEAGRRLCAERGGDANGAPMSSGRAWDIGHGAWHAGMDVLDFCNWTIGCLCQPTRSFGVKAFSLGSSSKKPGAITPKPSPFGDDDDDGDGATHTPATNNVSTSSHPPTVEIPALVPTRRKFSEVLAILDSPNRAQPQARRALSDGVCRCPTRKRRLSRRNPRGPRRPRWARARHPR
jgi:hypothetical protein